MIALAVGLAAGVGAVARLLLDVLVQRRVARDLPLGTLTVNLSGSFLLGLVTGLVAHAGLPHDVGVVLGVGFAGGYTTLSTWAWESLALVEAGRPGAAAANVVGSLGLGLLAAAAGLGLALL